MMGSSWCVGDKVQCYLWAVSGQRGKGGERGERGGKKRKRGKSKGKKSDERTKEEENMRNCKISACDASDGDYEGNKVPTTSDI